VRKGLITAREALARSVNTATVRTAQRVGIDKVIATAHRLGIASELRRDLSTSLGASEVNLLELTGAFAPFANGGNGVLPYAILEIRDAGGKVLYRRTGSGPGRVIQKAQLAPMIDMLSAVITGGTGRGAALDRPAIGKTGTSQDHRDAWFVGGTADYVAGVWLGNDDGAPMHQVTGGALPARLWKSFMTEANRGLEVRAIPGADGGFDLDSFIDSLFRGRSPGLVESALAGAGEHRHEQRPDEPPGGAGAQLGRRASVTKLARQQQPESATSAAIGSGVPS
jgi:penicillin-binding protein 1A